MNDLTVTRCLAHAGFWSVRNWTKRVLKVAEPCTNPMKPASYFRNIWSSSW